jgi:hypothetical protein
MRPRAALLLVLFAARPAAAGPWEPGRWHFYLQLRESALVADQRYDASGKLQPIAVALDASGATAPSSYRQLLTDLFGELGLAARLSVLFDFRAVSAIWQPLPGAPAHQAVGPSDLYLAGKLLLFDDELSAAVQIGVTVPIGSATAAVPLGAGDLRTDFTLLLGKLFEHPEIFLSIEAGARLRGAAQVGDPHAPGQMVSVQYSHEVRAAAQAGYTWRPDRPFLRALVFAIKLEGAYALQTPVEDGLGILVAQAASYLKLGPEITWRPRRGLDVTVGGHYFVAGRSLPAFGEAALAIGYGR